MGYFYGCANPCHISSPTFSLLQERTTSFRPYSSLSTARPSHGSLSVADNCGRFQRKVISSLLFARLEFQFGKEDWSFFSVKKDIQKHVVNRTKQSYILTPCATARPINDEQGPSVESAPEDAGTIVESLFGWLDVFNRFSRPHTVIGTVIGIISVSLLAIQSIEDISAAFFIGLIQALIPSFCMNIYVVGLNQVFDIEIDKVNKPYLPLASGEYSLNTGITIVALCAFLSLSMGILIGSRPLLWALSVSFVLGTAYSIELPFLRWKRFALLAASCILLVRAIVVQLAFYLHMQVFTFGRDALLTKPLLFATAFMCVFSVVIALFKDIPDVEGDRVFGIRTFSVRLGQERVFWVCVYLLQAAYCVAMAVGITSHIMWSRFATVIGHAIMSSILFVHSKRMDLRNKAAITSFYMFVWKLFYAEYLLIPLLR